MGPAVYSKQKVNTRDTSPMSVVSSASLEALNILSLVSDTPSLEKFLSTPASENPVSAAILATAILDTQPERPFPQTYNSAPLASRRPLSVARSASSVGSARSFQSCEVPDQATPGNLAVVERVGKDTIRGRLLPNYDIPSSSSSESTAACGCAAVKRL
jgi:hypothetical protein